MIACEISRKCPPSSQRRELRLIKFQCFALCSATNINIDVRNTNIPTNILIGIIYYINDILYIILYIYLIYFILYINID